MLPRCIYVIILENVPSHPGETQTLWGEPGALTLNHLNTIFFYLDTNLNFRLYIIKRRYERVCERVCVCLCNRVPVVFYPACRPAMDSLAKLLSQSQTASAIRDRPLSKRVVSHFPDDQLTSELPVSRSLWAVGDPPGRRRLRETGWQIDAGRPLGRTARQLNHPPASLAVSSFPNFKKAGKPGTCMFHDTGSAFFYFVHSRYYFFLCGTGSSHSLGNGDEMAAIYLFWLCVFVSIVIWAIIIGHTISS